jgi:hypothetical protein
MRAARCAVLGALIGVTTALAEPAALHAQPAQTTAVGTDADAEYAQLVSGALSEFERGHWEQARAWFERAHALRPNARTLWGLGVTAFELGRYTQAIEELQIAVVDRRLPLSDEQRTQARDVIARAARHVAMLSVDLVPAQAVLSVDGLETQSRELVLSPGSYTLAARAPGFHERELSLQLAPGEQRELRLTLPPIELDVGATTVPARAIAATSDEPRARDGGSVLGRWWFWTAVALVVAGGAVATYVVVDGGGDDAEKVDASYDALTRQP